MSNSIQKTKESDVIPRSLNDIKHENSGFEVLGICMDNSGSMTAQYGEGKSRFEASQEAMNALWEATDHSICEMHVWSFDTETRPVEVPAHGPPTLHRDGVSGGTDFHAPLRAILAENCTRGILCSDGESSFPETQVLECVERQVPIDCIFIGPRGSAGEQTLQRIADETGGIFATAEDAASLVRELVALETSNRLLLEHHEEGFLPDDVIKL